MTLPLPSVSADPIWIDSDRALQDCCHLLRGVSAVAVDTEFMRSSTFYPKAALIQLFAGDYAQGNCYLVDPLSIRDFSPLVELLTDPHVVKVFHACSEDLEVFNTLLSCVPAPLVDTQLAAGLLGYGASASYGALVETVLDVTLEKGETRSDWLQRPLQAKQLHYAVQDVTYLLPLYERLVGDLQMAGRLPWLREDCDALVANASTPLDLHAFYPRIKSAWKLGKQELGVLRQLSFWREQQARALDMPRNHVLHERVLWALAKSRPRSSEALRKIEDLEARKIKRFGAELLEVVDRALAADPNGYPELLPAPLPIAQRDLVKLLKGAIAKKAAELNVVPEILAKKADYDFIVRSGMASDEYRLPERLQGWRYQVIGKSLLELAIAQSKTAANAAAEGNREAAGQAGNESI